MDENESDLCVEELWFRERIERSGELDVSLCQRRRVRGGSGGVEFDCPEEFGYYPHPTDCTQYYVCVFGGALLESCTGGLMYSHELQTCDWPRNVGCGGSSDHASLSTVRVTDPRTRGDARSSTRPVTVTIPSRDQDHQRRQQEDFVKKQYPLYAEDSRVTPESAAEEDEGPEGGERQQRVYRGQPAGLGAAPRERDSLRHTGAVTNTIPASAISGVRGDKGVTYTLVQQSAQPQQQQLYRPVDASGYSDVEVSIESRPVQAQRARLVSTPATYNATTTTIYSSSAAPPVAQQYNANYYALYDEDEVELYRDVDYSQVSGGRQTNAGNDNYRGQTNYKVQQVQQPEVVQQQSYIGRGNTNSYLSSQQQPQQTYVQQDVQPEISYGGAALDSPDYNDNYNSAEDNGGIQYNQAPQQQRTSVNRNRQRGKASAGTAIRDEADRAPSSSYSSPAITRQSPTTTTSTTTTTTTTYSTPTDSSSPRRGASSRDGTAYIRAEPASPRRGYPTQRPIQQARRNPPQPQTVEAVESDSLPSRLSAAYPISSSSDSSDQPLSQNSIEPFDYVNPSRARGSFNREPSYTYSNTSDSTVGQRFKSTSVLPKEKPHVRIRPTTASPESQSTTGSPSRGSSSSRTQGRGSSPYSSSSVSGRSRPTLKPSTSIVSKASEYIDVYRFPPSRPEPVYPQPRVDQAAAKCRKDICLLPDCNCGGKDIPGGLEPQNVPQIVLLTFDDSVNDLNKQLYSDLFEKGRKNPNGCPISATFYVSHEWTDYSQVQNLYAAGHEMASHSISHSFGEQFSQRKWSREINGQREILAAYGGVKLEDIRGMRAPFLAVGGNKMFKMLYDTNFTYDSSMPVYENRPPSWPYTFDYKVFHDCMIPPCPTRSYPGVWEVPMVMWQDLNGGRCSMGDACSNPPTSDGVYKMLIKNFERHYTTNRAPFGLYYHAAWFTQPHHKEGFEAFLDTIVAMDDVWLVTNWQAIQWVRDPTPLSHVKQFQPFDCNYPDRPRKCNNPKVCNLWHKSGVRYMRTCQPCPDVYPWTGKTGVKNSRVDNEVED
ncbi:uncharacterized protein [Hetaerina americana]|uniref:uncharacterized protein n=1 Tax=Hetaerina americana TaxID=62018 RepID=UPI003A7F5613